MQEYATVEMLKQQQAKLVALRAERKTLLQRCAAMQSSACHVWAGSGSCETVGRAR